MPNNLEQNTVFEQHRPPEPASRALPNDLSAIPTHDPQATLRFCQALVAAMRIDAGTLMTNHSLPPSFLFNGAAYAEDVPRRTPATVPHPDISVVLPFYNEEDNLPILYERLSEVLRATGLTYELVFIDVGGGTGTVNRAIVQRLAAIADVWIDLLTSALGRDTEYEQFSERVHIFKVPVQNQNLHHSTNRELLTYAGRALPVALHFHGRYHYDLCFAWSAVPAGGVALALHTLTGLPYVVRVCGPDIPGFEERYNALYPLLTPVIRRIWRGAEHVIAKCRAEADMIYTVDSTPNMLLVANSVDLAAFPATAQILDGGPLRLLSVARLIERKGQHDLIAAVRRLLDAGVDVTLDLVGEGDARAANEAQAAALGIAERVRFQGYVPREAIAAHYAAAHVFVLPSYNEGMSVATREALAAGLPVVVTRTGGTAELVAEGVNGLTFDWADVETLTNYLHTLATDRALARRMGAASRKRALASDWDAISQRFVELFEQMTGSASSFPPEERIPLGLVESARSEGQKL
jgi:glycosyltransferase involved in cell wall biosynthesis